MRAKIISIFSLIFLLLFTSAAAAAEKAPGENAGDGRSININGKIVTLLYPSRPAGSDTYLALCDFSMITGATYRTHPGSGAITLIKGARRLDLFIGGSGANINGRPATVSAVPAEVDGTVYIPFKFAASCLGYSISSGDGNYLSLNYNCYIKISPGDPTGNINDFLPRGADFIPAPPADGSKDNLSPASADLDGDGKAEYASFYSGIGNKYGLLLYNGTEGQYNRIWQKDELFAPDFLGTGSFGGSRPFLLAGWKMGDPLGSFLEVYSLEEGGLDVLFAGLYHKIEIADLDADGGNELAIWQKDQGDTYSVMIYKWNGSRFTPVEICPPYYEKVLEYYESLPANAAPARALYYRKAEAFLKSGSFDQAVKYSLDGMRLPPGYPSGQTFQGLRGMALVEINRFADALPLLQSALGPFPGPARPDLRLALARSYFDSGRADRGLLELSRAMSESNDWPGFDRAYQMFGAQMEQYNR